MASNLPSMKGKTAEQKKVIKYLLETGCIAALINMKDEEYRELVRAKRDSIDTKKRAIDKIGLDESEINEINPVQLEGYVFGRNSYSKKLSNNTWVSSKYHITWLFFSSTQVYMYRYEFNMDEDSKKEKTEEYFYKDIVNFTTSSETIENIDSLGNKSNVEVTMFSLTVPGDKYQCSIYDYDEETEISIKAMKQKLREKKL